MENLLVPLSEAIPGMWVAENIEDSRGEVLVPQNELLSEDMIQILKRNDIKEIKINSNIWHDVISVQKQTKENYVAFTKEVRELLESIERNEPIEMSRFEDLCKNLDEEFDTDGKIIGCINLFTSAENYTYNHSVNVALLGKLIGKWMKYKPEKIHDIMMAGLLHDIGKMKISRSIIDKPDKLTDEEFEEVKHHSLYSYDYLKDNEEVSIETKLGILLHHERSDGSGYPYGVHDSDINDIAKVLAVADVYDAMLSEKPYRKKYSPFEIIQLLHEGIFGKLDKKICYTFINKIARYYIGTFVTLNTGEMAEVVAINPACIYRPILKIQDKYIDMSENAKLQIVNVV